MGLFVKLSTEVPVTTLVFVRFALALPMILVLLWRKKVVISPQKIYKYSIRSLAGLGALYCYYGTLKHLPLVDAVTLRNAAPLFIPVITYFAWRVVVTKRRIIALFIGFLGVIVLLQPSGDIFKFASLLGVASAFLGALAALNIRRLSKVESALTTLTYYFLIGTVITFFPMLIGYKGVPNKVQWIYLLAAGLSALIFQYTMTKAYTHISATKVGSLNYLSVALGGLYGWLFLGERYDLWIGLGVILIVSGALLALTGPGKSRHIPR
ncbi:MAG: hypothetical protein A3D96_04820 [Chlamydiae bacterium RIFCSPHIGHO2_12_FULL_44_59]|nr:MAG: hypothetical protein A3D96_04820 [Chlamydiae bacterium RIFCSPHIGHO2_12_FULL_44_59]